MAVGSGRTLGKVQSCGVCSGRGYSHSVLARLLERSYFFERVISGILSVLWFKML